MGSESLVNLSMQYRYIAVEGNIGAGKTTLATLLAAHYNARLVPEEFAENTFLPKFYADPGRYAFPLELSFLADRYRQLKKLLTEQDLFHSGVVSDYLFIKSKLFARINLQGDEYELFSSLFDIMDLQLPAPDLLIFLECGVDSLQQRIRKRGRDYEQGIGDDYLERVAGVYGQYLKNVQDKLLIVDAAAADFPGNPAHFERLTTILDSGEALRVRYLTFD